MLIAFLGILAMSIGMVVVCAAASFASTLSAFAFAARSMGWRHGAIFNSQKPTLIAMACLAGLLGRLIYGVVSGEVSILFALIPVPFAVLGSMIVHPILKQNSGMAAIVLSPLLTFLSIFVKL